MYTGKHQQRRKPRSNRSLVLTISVIALVVCIVGASLAYLFTKSNAITNTFTPSHVSCYVDETFSSGTKSDVKIENTGDIDAYIRAKVVITWKNAAGNVYGAVPSTSDYSISYNTTDWFKGSDGFWYCKSAVASNAKTANLIVSCTRTSTTAPDGYELSVEIIADAIQSVPTSVVTNNWGVTVDNDGKLSASAS